MQKDKPKLLVIAGPNGSGKTSVTSQILKHEWVKGCVYINPDNLSKELLKCSICKTQDIAACHAKFAFEMLLLGMRQPRHRII